MRGKSMAAGGEVAEMLRDAIISGQLKPRERLIEADLSARFQVSRTPVREALKSLVSTGLVVMEPYKGATVADIDVDEIRDIYEVRTALEGHATFLAVPRLTPADLVRLNGMLDEMERYERDLNRARFAEVNEAFHNEIYRHCGNAMLQSMISELLARTFFFRRSSWQSVRNIALVSQTHRRLFEAIEARDAALAQKIAAEHIRLFLTNVDLSAF